MTPVRGVHADFNPSESIRELKFDIPAKVDAFVANTHIQGEDKYALCTVAPH